MDEHIEEARELQRHDSAVIQGCSVKDVDSLGDRELDRVIPNQQDQNPGSQAYCDVDQADVQHKANHTQEEVEATEQKQCDPAQVLLDQNPVEGDPVPVSLHQVALDADHQSPTNINRVWSVDQHHDHVGSQLHQDQKDWNRVPAAANRDEAVESCERVPALLITQAEEQPALGPSPRPAEPYKTRRPADPSLSSSTDGGDPSCSDLLSLRSDSLSLCSEPTVSRRSDEDDTRSVTASSFMSLFHRLQLDPLEKDWWRSSAVGNTEAQRQLLAQEPSLLFKKDFVTTALHWAAKQGRQEVVDWMVRCGADVNVRSGYTALHLASIHGHQHIVSALVSSHNAKTSIRDYHGKKAVQYWTGSSDVFHGPASRSGGRRTQRRVLPSLLLSRSRSHGQLNLEFGTPPRSTDLQL